MKTYKIIKLENSKNLYFEILDGEFKNVIFTLEELSIKITKNDFKISIAYRYFNKENLEFFDEEKSKLLDKTVNEIVKDLIIHEVDLIETLTIKEDYLLSNKVSIIKE